MRHLVSLITLLCLTATAITVVAADTIDAQVLAIFEKHCAECHKSDSKKRIPLNRDTNLARLRDEVKHITAGSAVKSELFQRVTSTIDDDDHMPKSEGSLGDKDYRGPLSVGDITVLKQWIEGSSASADSPKRKFISDEDINRRISADLNSLPPQIHPAQIRYFTLTNLYNQTDAKGQPSVSDADLSTYRAAVNKLLNSLSWSDKVETATPIDPEQTVLRIYLSSYKWTAEFWERIVSFYPYAILSHSVVEKEAVRLTHASLPRVRGDWFVFALSQPPLYYEALQLPGLDGSDHADVALEKQLQVQVRRNLQGGRALRAAFELSGVSQGNRMIERHPQGDGGGYWKSYDFDKNRKDQAGGDLFAAPLGPPGSGLASDARLEFHQDGGEIVFALPNGLHGYLLINDQGKLINRGPTNIVRDASRADGAIINGISCISCHQQGLFPPPPDQLATVAKGLTLASDDRALVTALYDQARVAAAVRADITKFQAAAAQCGVITGASAEEPVRKLYDKFMREITLDQLASEFGQDGQHFLLDLKRSRAERVRLLAAKLETGVALPRQNFINNFETITQALELGDVREFNAPPFEEFGGQQAVRDKVAEGKTPPPDGSVLDTGAVGKAIQVKLPGDVLMKFAYCPAGSFMMGSPASEAGREECEAQVNVRISQGFWMGQTEVTQAQWNALMRHNPSNYIGKDLPVEGVSWEGAQAFIVKLNEQVPLTSRWEYALPTEAQWEYACRAGTESVFSIGDTLTSKQANFNGGFPYGTTKAVPYLDRPSPVASYQPNAWGIYDMHGNVYEWCRDAWDGTSELPGGTDPVASVGSLRVRRGGSWSYRGQHCRSAARNGGDRADSDSNLGSRVVVVPAGR